MNISLACMAVAIKTQKLTLQKQKVEESSCQETSPPHHQWCEYLNSCVFVCGRCKDFFKTRLDVRSQRRTCEDRQQREHERFANTLREKSSTLAQKRRETEILFGITVNSRQDRPRNLRHFCKHWRKDIQSAGKKSEHERRCALMRKPTKIYPTN